MSFDKTTIINNYIFYQNSPITFKINIETKLLFLKFTKAYTKQIHAKKYLLNNADF